MDSRAFYDAVDAQRAAVESALRDNPADDDSITLTREQMALLRLTGRAFVPAGGKATHFYLTFNRTNREFWVREKWHELHWNRAIDDEPDQIVYEAGGNMLLPDRSIDDESFPARDDDGNVVPWKNPEDMPRWASRHRVNIINVNVVDTRVVLELRLIGEKLNIFLNGKAVLAEPVLTYEDVIALANLSPRASVVYRGHDTGILGPGQSIRVTLGLVINAIMTGSA